jgi:hypothetical protein
LVIAPEADAWYERRYGASRGFSSVNFLSHRTG